MKVTFKDVTLSYDGKKDTLKNLNFTIPDGALVSLLGPSGGGKTTTLNLISGLLPATSGHIYFGDEDVTKKDALARKVGMVFQNYSLYPHLTVRDNIAFPLKMQKVSKAERYKRAEELAKLVHVDDQLDKKPAGLSGGQQQRVAIARALAKSPSLLLLDEPLSNLDARLRIEMRQEIRRIQQETGVTTIFVTHDQDEALHISDHIMVLSFGSIQQFSTPAELYERPSNLFVAKFIGEPVINSVPADVLRADLVESVPASVLAQAHTVGIRSEAIVPFDNGQGMVAKIHATLQQSQKYGRESTAYLTYNGQQLLSTELAGLPASQTEGDFFLTKAGFFLFNEQGALIFGGEAHDK
ncbi:MAG: ABC transporter ATP-binding protein [Lactobacillus sp.]|uniref:ABC transporter ATP-binding protein n=1 Tax=Lacticaseibacillus suilingensis TaxID=2799577 RepID=A0ABW4BKJ9_9LACO|nr:MULTISPECIES: ABC transporter ATP-binding protein [Lacticaseibacillus]MCI1894111.1 ABC transporter ATP-binding protein [Lactobacillus sp.]MCI1918465.1 ABC transporter ATP-binding protein [Lactobacillus sp.]MCI1941427.1 ABC transporter ATP-binding protein [Lactobacillus sp.]MCI1972062.1 ABC transporter ATP-binding protein [Lactobacillus sp.]MCI2016095.1 ABC transporter ATP-binding protein [Lactobacillus sp.]